MANDGVVPQQGARELISSPDLRRLQKISLGSVTSPYKEIRRYLPAGSKLSPEDRATAGRLRGELAGAIFGADPNDEARARHVIVSEMLMVYPLAGAGAQAGRARGNAYRDALSGIPSWALARAVKLWHGGRHGDAHDYRWAPAPAVLRRLSEEVLAPYRAALDHIGEVLAAGTIDDALAAKPRPTDAANRLAPQPRRM